MLFASIKSTRWSPLQCQEVSEATSVMIVVHSVAELECFHELGLEAWFSLLMTAGNGLPTPMPSTVRMLPKSSSCDSRERFACVAIGIANGGLVLERLEFRNGITGWCNSASCLILR